MGIIGKVGLTLIMMIAAAGTVQAKDPVAVIKTEKGDITLKLLKEDAPKHVENFIKLAKSGF